MNLGTNIRALRKRKGLTLEQVGERFGIKRSSVAGWESNSSRPDLDKLMGLAELFGVSVDFLLSGDADNPVPAKAKVEWPFTQFTVEQYQALSPESKTRIEGFVSGIVGEWETRPGNRRAV